MQSTVLDSTSSSSKELFITSNEPGSKLVVLGMAIPPLIGNPYNGALYPYGLGLMSLSPIIWKNHGS